MNSLAARVSFTLPLVLAVLTALAGCSAVGGNRRDGRPMITRTAELRKSIGRPVTLVGTARDGDGDANGPADLAASIDLRGGTVLLPAYAWPDGYVGQPVMVSGTLLSEKPAKGELRVYRLGEIQSAALWSR